jgi:hypothetical protein
MEGGGQLVEEPRKMIVASLPSMPELRVNDRARYVRCHTRRAFGRRHCRRRETTA